MSSNGGPDNQPLADLEHRVCVLAAEIAVSTAEFLRLLGEFDAREGWAGVGIRSCAHWLSWRCGMALGTARDHVRVARRLRRLPVTAATFAEGRLSYSKVRAVCRVATPETEADLVATGLSATASQVERLTRVIRAVAPEQVPSARELAVPSPPRLQWEWDEDDTLRISGRLSTEDGAALLAALTDVVHARAVRTAPDEAAHRGPTDGAEPESVPVRLPRSGSFASAVVGDAARAAGTAVGVGEDGRPASEVVVHVDADLLTGLRNDADRASARGHVEDGRPLALQVIERLACDSGVRLTSHGSDGRTLDLGRRRRKPSERQLQCLRRRDGGCVLPGCGRTRFLHAHHVQFWSRGGRTSLDNLVLLCGEHHRALHHGRFAIEGLTRQRFRFEHPDGHVIDYAPSLPTAGRAATGTGAHTLVSGETLTPNWHGERLEPDALVDQYVRTRLYEGPVHDPWSLAA
jgi:hypothetical protein